MTVLVTVMLLNALWKPFCSRGFPVGLLGLYSGLWWRCPRTSRWRPGRNAAQTLFVLVYEVPLYYALRRCGG